MPVISLHMPLLLRIENVHAPQPFCSTRDKGVIRRNKRGERAEGKDRKEAAKGESVPNRRLFTHTKIRGEVRDIL